MTTHTQEGETRSTAKRCLCDHSAADVIVNHDCPLHGQKTHTSGRKIPVEEFVARGRAAQQAADDIIFYTRLRECMKRWAARYAEAEHAKKHVAETRLLMQEIDERILALNRD